MNITIRDLDDATYRRAKSMAALENKTVGQAVTEALKDWIAKPRQKKGNAFLEVLENPPDWGFKTNLAKEVDEYVYR